MSPRFRRKPLSRQRECAVHDHLFAKPRGNDFVAIFEWLKHSLGNEPSQRVKEKLFTHQ